MSNKKLIKFFTYTSIFTLLFSSSHHIKAFGGYTHYYICSKVVRHDERLKDLSEEEKLAYKSGAVIADVGRFYFDDVYPASDEETFKSELINIASQSNDIKLKLFALGWSDHVIQDRHTSEIFDRIFQSTKNYRIRCGKCDSFFYDKTGYLSTDTLYCPTELIKSVYGQLKSESILLHVKNKMIKKETRKILMALYAQSWLGLNKLSDVESAIAKDEFRNLSTLCGSNNPDYEILF